MFEDYKKMKIELDVRTLMLKKSITRKQVLTL